MEDIKVENSVFMIGMPRSGTTVISEAISMHEYLGWSSNYINRFPTLRCLAFLNRILQLPGIGLRLRGKKKQMNGFLDFIRRYLPYSVEAFPVWRYYIGDKFLFDYLINQMATEEEKERVLNFVRAVLKFHGKKRFFSKFTGPSRIRYLESIFKDPYYIHVIRDPRAVVSSLLNVGFWKQCGGIDSPWWKNGLPEEYLREWINSGRSPVTLAAVQWKRVIELTWEEKEVVGADRYLELRYEDFMARPHEWLKRIFDFTGLPDSKAAHAYLDSTGKVMDMNYKFKSSLTRNDITLIERVTHGVAKKAGYDL